MNQIFKDLRASGDTVLRQSQLVTIRMLKYVNYYCRKYDIQYFLICGSLIGAIRHKGIIPWDDDIDVGMTRENYNKFVRLVVPLLPKEIFFQCHDTDNAYPKDGYVNAKLRDKYSRYTKNKYKYHDGLQLDIFVFDYGYFPNKTLIILQNFIISYLKVDRYKMLNLLRKMVTKGLVYSCNYLHRPGQIKQGVVYLKPTEISNVITCQFEDIEVFIPAGWEKYLERQFGNYMEFPPEEKRVQHHEILPDPFNPCDHKEILFWGIDK